MLQSIRERAQGVIAWFIVVLISVPFALWGISSYLEVGSEPVLATVDGEEITERQFEENYRNFRQNLRERLGQKYNPDLINETVLRKEVLDTLVARTALSQTAVSLGLRVGDEHVRSVIRSNPEFQVAGAFNQQAYEQTVRRIGLSTAAYEAQRRASLVNEQLPKVITGTEFATKRELNDLVRLRQQQRAVSYLQISPSRYNASIKVSDDEVRAHFDANQASYMVSERVKLEYLDLDASAIAKTLTADDEVLQGYYSSNKNQYQTAEERRASHILFTVEEGADAEIVQAKAEGALKRIQDGEDFAVLAKALSEDPGSADLGGDLDYFERGVMAEAFEDAVFKLNEDEVSGVVRTEFGFHIIKLTAIRPAQGKSFEEAKELVRAAYLSSEAERKFYEYAERLGELVWEDQNSLSPASDALGLPLQTSEWMTRDGGVGALDNPKVLNAAFSDDVLNEGLNSEAIELSQDHMIVVRVVAHETATPESFEAVKKQISEQLLAEGGAKKAQEQAESIIGELNAGKLLTDVAGELGQVAIQKITLNRDSRDSDGELLRKVFVMPRPADGRSSVASTQLADGSVAIIVLESVIDGTAESANELGGDDALTDALQRARGRSYFEQLQAAATARADVVITEDEK